MNHNNEINTVKITHEFELVKILVNFLLENNYKVKLEVPNMGQSVDIVAAKGHEYTFIEAKLNNWKRAIEQCRTHEIVADYICIGIATKTIKQRYIDEAVTLGYGIIHCNPEEKVCNWIIEPKMNHQVWLPQKQQVLNHLRQIEYEN